MDILDTKLWRIAHELAHEIKTSAQTGREGFDTVYSYVEPLGLLDKDDERLLRACSVLACTALGAAGAIPKVRENHREAARRKELERQLTLYAEVRREGDEAYRLALRAAGLPENDNPYEEPTAALARPGGAGR
jgi:hypothetical protein